MLSWFKVKKLSLTEKKRKSILSQSITMEIQGVTLKGHD